MLTAAHPGDLDIGFGELTFKHGSAGDVGDFLVLQMAYELNLFLWMGTTKDSQYLLLLNLAQSLMLYFLIILGNFISDTDKCKVSEYTVASFGIDTHLTGKTKSFINT